MDVPRPVPISMEIAAAGEQKDGAPAPFERFGIIGQIAESCPGTPARVGHREDSRGPIDSCRLAFISESQKPGIMLDEIRTVMPIEIHFASGLLRVIRTEKNNQMMAGEVRWIDLDPRRTGQVQVGDAELQVGGCHWVIVFETARRDTP